MRKPGRQHPHLLRQLGLSQEDLSKHFFLCGQTGSGKTTVIRMLLAAYIALVPFGGLHCCVKADEADWVCDMVTHSRLRNRLMRLAPAELNFTFNIAGYECSRPGGTPATLTRLLQRLNEQLRRHKGKDSEQSFWRNLFHDFMHYATCIAWLAHGPAMTLEHIHQIISSAPGSNSEIRDELGNFRPAFQATPCYQMLALAMRNCSSDAQKRMLTRAVDFFLVTQLRLGDKARSAGVQECCSILGYFMLSPFYETFCNPQSSFTPELVLHGIYAVVDCPVLIYQEAAQLCQTLLAIMAVEAALRQSAPENHVLIVRDETQMLLADPLWECMVLSVARSHKLSFWSAVQNTNLLIAALGGDHQAERQLHAILANYGTKFILANGDVEGTNRLFSTMFGQHREPMLNISQRESQSPESMVDAIFGTAGVRFSTSEIFHDRVPVDRFLHLRRGGPPDYVIDCYMSQAGRVFADTGLPYKLVTFQQDRS